MSRGIGLVQHEFAHVILQKYGLAGQLDLGRLGLVYKAEGSDEVVDTAPFLDMLDSLQKQMESLKHREAPGMITKRETLLQLQKVLERHVHHPAVSVGRSVPLQAQRARAQARGNASEDARELLINEVRLQQVIRLVQTAVPAAEAESVAKVLREALPRAVSTDRAGRVRAIEAVLKSVLPKPAPGVGAAEVRPETLADVLREAVASEAHVQQLTTAIREVVAQPTMPSRGQVNQLVKVLREAVPERTQAERVAQEVGRPGTVDERVKSLATVLREVLPGSSSEERIEAGIQRFVTAQKIPQVIREVLPAVAEIERVERMIRPFLPNRSVVRREHVETLIKEVRQAGAGGERTDSLERVIRTILPIREGVPDAQVQRFAGALREAAAGTGRDAEGLERIVLELLPPQAVQDREQVRTLVEVLRETAAGKRLTPGERLEQAVQTIVPQAALAQEVAHVLREVAIGETYSVQRFQQVLRMVLPAGFAPKPQQVTALITVMREVASGEAPIERLESGLREVLPFREASSGESIKALVNALQEVVSNHTQSLRLERILRTVLSSNAAPSQAQVEALVTVLHETMIGSLQAERLERVLRDVFPAQATNATFVTVVRDVLTGRAPLEQLKQIILRPAALQAESLAESLLRAMPGSGQAERLARDVREVWASEAEGADRQTGLLAEIVHTVLSADRMSGVQDGTVAAVSAGAAGSALFAPMSIVQNETFVNAIRQSLFMQQGTVESGYFIRQFAMGSNAFAGTRLIYGPARVEATEGEQVVEARSMNFERLLRLVLQRTSKGNEAVRNVYAANPAEEATVTNLTKSVIRNERIVETLRTVFLSRGVDGQERLLTLMQNVLEKGTGSASQSGAFVNLVRAIGLSPQVGAISPYYGFMQNLFESSTNIVAQAGALASLARMMQTNSGVAGQSRVLAQLIPQSSSVMAPNAGAFAISLQGVHAPLQSMMQNFYQTNSAGLVSQGGAFAPLSPMIQSLYQTSPGVAPQAGAFTLLPRVMQSIYQSSTGVAPQSGMFAPLPFIIQNLYQMSRGTAPQTGALASLPTVSQSLYQSSTGLLSRAGAFELLPLIMQRTSTISPLQEGAVASLPRVMQSLYQSSAGLILQAGAFALQPLIMQRLFQTNADSVLQKGALASLPHVLQSVYLSSTGLASQAGAIAPLPLMSTASTWQAGAFASLPSVIQNLFQSNVGSVMRAGAFVPLPLIMQSLYQSSTGLAPQEGVLASLPRVMQSLYQTSTSLAQKAGAFAPISLILQSLHRQEGAYGPLSIITRSLQELTSQTGALASVPSRIQNLYQTNFSFASQPPLQNFFRSVLQPGAFARLAPERATSLMPQLQSMLLHDHHWHTSINETNLQLAPQAQHVQQAQQAQQAQPPAQSDAFSYSDTEAPTLHLANLQSDSGEVSFMDMYHAAIGNQPADAAFSVEDGVRMEHLRPKQAAAEPQHVTIRPAIPPAASQAVEQAPAQLLSLSNLPPGELDKLVDQLYRELERRVDFERQLRGF